LLGTRKRRGIAAVAAVAAIGALVALPGGAPARGCGGSGGIPNGDCNTDKYVNPFHHNDWYEGRIDMGVDYFPIHRHKVVAIGKARILGSDSNSGWPGGHYIWYRLLGGDHKGAIIFVAETMKRLAHKGKVVQPGDRIATALPRGTGIEIGWADNDGQPHAAPCYSEGVKTASGKRMARFLKSLGAQVGDRPGPGSDDYDGARC
jgi:hypothetical protein